METSRLSAINHSDACINASSEYPCVLDEQELNAFVKDETSL